MITAETRRRRENQGLDIWGFSLRLCVSAVCTLTLALAGSNADKLNDYPIKRPLGCTDGYVLTWVGANNRFECLVSAASGGAAGSTTAMQFNLNGVLGATSGFTWTSASRRLALGAAGTEGAIRLPSLDSAFFHVKGTSSILNGVRDNLFRFGWNCDSEDATEPQFCNQMESHYYDTTLPSSHSSEMHVGAYTSAAGVGRRPIQINVFRTDNSDATHLANDVQVVVSGELDVKNSASNVYPFSVLDGGPVVIGNSTYVRHANNNVPFLKQARAAGTFSTLAQLNSADRWLISPDAEDVINQAGVHYSGASITDYLFKADKTNRLFTVGVGNASDQGIRIKSATGYGVSMGDGTNQYSLARNSSTGALNFVGTQGGFQAYTFDGGLAVTGLVAATSLSGTGAAITTLSASNISSGSLADARLSANVPLLNAVNTFTGTGAMVLTQALTNAKLKLVGPDSNGNAAQQLYTLGSTDYFLTGALNTAGVRSYGVQNPNTGTYAYKVNYSDFIMMVGDSPTVISGGAKLQVVGGIQNVTQAKPSCVAALRGTQWYVAGAGGVLDTFELCRKDAADAYAWVTLF